MKNWWQTSLEIYLEQYCTQSIYIYIYSIIFDEWLWLMFLPSGKRPFGVSILYMGWDKHYGFQLYQSDPSGNYGGWKSTCIGNNSAVRLSSNHTICLFNCLYSNRLPKCFYQKMCLNFRGVFRHQNTDILVIHIVI